jgi:NTP pyrophosphatase (non-canonical NTP hydrolase)
MDTPVALASRSNSKFFDRNDHRVSISQDSQRIMAILEEVEHKLNMISLLSKELTSSLDEFSELMGDEMIQLMNQLNQLEESYVLESTALRKNVPKVYIFISFH